MRSSLECNICNVFRAEGGESLRETDSSSTPGGHKFPAIHFSYYAWHGTRVRRITCFLHLSTNNLQGDDAPPDIHPNLLRRQGVVRPTQFLHQLVPHISKEMMENKREYKNLCNTFSDLFAWVENKVRFSSLYLGSLITRLL
jgi:hypothetical protein